MTHQQKDKDFSSWLEKLQQESWQLELIISGFVIFLLLGALSYFEANLVKLAYSLPPILVSLVYIISVATFVLFLNLCIHLGLRGLWIGAIGLRYVSGKIDFDQLKYAPVFQKFLEKKYTFDEYIERLEKICSSVFALSFLMVFTLLSVITSFLLMFLIKEGIDWIFPDIKWIRNTIINILGIFLLIYFIDYITGSWIKRIRWFSRIYYPLYRLFGWATLAFIYRPLYHNFIDYKYGRWTIFLIAPYLIIVVFMGDTNMGTHPFFPHEMDIIEKSTKNQLNNSFYDDSRNNDALKGVRTKFISIPSKNIDKSYTELFIGYYQNANQILKDICSDSIYLSTETITLFESAHIDLGDNKEKEKANAKKIANNFKQKAILNCIDEIVDVQIDDTIQVPTDFLFAIHPTEQIKGFYTHIDLIDIKRGRHNLQVLKKRLHKSDSISIDTVVIPFWMVRE